MANKASTYTVENFAKSLLLSAKRFNDFEPPQPHWTKENVIAIVTWAACEGTKAAYNPLATTIKFPGGTNFNTHGVKNYRQYLDGVDATLNTLRAKEYRRIMGLILSGKAKAEQIVEEIGRSRWGTGLGCLRSTLKSVRRGYKTYAGRKIYRPASIPMAEEPLDFSAARFR